MTTTLVNNDVKWFYSGVAELGAVFTFAGWRGRRPVPRMMMWTTDENQIQLLEEMCRVLGVPERVTQYRSRSDVGSRKPRHVIRIDGADVYRYVLPFFDEFRMRGDKARQYDIWRDLALALQRGDCDSGEGMAWFRRRWEEKSPHRPAGGRSVT